MRLIAILILLSKICFAELSPSVLLFNTWDFQRCDSQISKAIALGAKTINIVPTIHFLAQKNSAIEYFCYQRSFCEKISSKVIEEIESSLLACSKIAAKAGVNLSFTPHIDDGGGRGIWRNNLIFDPLADYQGTNYKRIILDPIYRIINKLKDFKIDIDFSFQGEMGATIFHFPKSYLKILKEYKSKISKNVQLGISLNYNSLGGQNHFYAPLKRKRVQKLIDASDFLGFSFYHPVETSLKDHFSFGVKKFLWELKRKRLNVSDNKVLHFTEIGLGGGTIKNDGRTRGLNLIEIQQAPYAGLYSSYNQFTSPWEIEENFLFRRKFYLQLDHFLNTQAKTNPVTKAYVWNADSWDVFGLYPNTEGYADPYLVNYLF